MAPILDVEFPASSPMDADLAQGKCFSGHVGFSTPTLLVKPFADFPMKMASDPKLFICGHCLRCISEDEPVYMRRDAAFCSLRCRHRGPACADSPTDKQRGDETQSATGTPNLRPRPTPLSPQRPCDSPIGMATTPFCSTPVDSPELRPCVGLPRRRPSMSHLNELEDLPKLPPPAIVIEENDCHKPAATKNVAPAAFIRFEPRVAPKVNKVGLGVDKQLIPPMSPLKFKGNAPRLLLASVGFVVTKLAALVPWRSRPGHDDGNCFLSHTTIRTDHSFTLAEQAAATMLAVGMAH
mmetsp:Transcript_107148/g.308299  ORF Transcript_107148/g.308299 Transcript_107148/m.308299 type:complete len:295 (-) Transcript_107148:393-1277(-)